jgi:hypothetical protein
MKSLFVKFAAAGIALAFLAACGGSGATVPGGTTTTQAASVGSPDAGTPIKLSGQYVGTITDSKNGRGKFSLSLSQYRTDLGGTLTNSSNALIANVSWHAKGTTIDGTSVTVTGSTYCTFDHSASYDSKRNVLLGGYRAVYGCTGETGTYHFKHQCYYRGTAGAEIRPEIGGRPC